MKKNPKAAFTIVETLITLVSITIMISGPLVFMVRSYQYAESIKARTVLVGLSQEGLELATSLRNKSLSEFQAAANACAGNSCSVSWSGSNDTPVFNICSECKLFKLSTDENSFYQTIGDVDTGFYRYLTFTAPGTQSYIVESIAYTVINGVRTEVKLKKVIQTLDIK